MRAIAIVGAGLAGLYAARLLNAKGVDFVLIEARDRLGGRILTTDPAGVPCEYGFDLGPSWYWPHAQPAMAALINELGLRSFCQHSDSDVVFERMSRETPQRYRGFEQEQHSMRGRRFSCCCPSTLARTARADLAQCASDGDVARQLNLEYGFGRCEAMGGFPGC